MFRHNVAGSESQLLTRPGSPTCCCIRNFCYDDRGRLVGYSHSSPSSAVSRQHLQRGAIRQLAAPRVSRDGRVQVTQPQASASGVFSISLLVSMHFWVFFWSFASETGVTSSLRAFLVAQVVKNLPTIQETQVQSLGQEDLLEKETATHYSILACRIPWTEEPGRLQPMGSQKFGHELRLIRTHSLLHPQGVVRINC